MMHYPLNATQLETERIANKAKELEANFIKIRCEQFGETPEQAQELYNQCIMTIAANSARYVANCLRHLNNG